MTKKSYWKKRKKNPDACHWEGKFLCTCRIRKYRAWLAMKRGKDEPA